MMITVDEERWKEKGGEEKRFNHKEEKEEETGEGKLVIHRMTNWEKLERKRITRLQYPI